MTNLIGNGVATMVVARWEGALDLERARAVLAAGSEAWPRSRKPWPTPWPRACPWCPSSPFRSHGGREKRGHEGKRDITDINRL